MRARPDGVEERELAVALAEGWRIDAAAMRYAAAGGGSFHWAVRDGEGRRWFVTVDDLDDKAWFGDSRPAVMAGLRSAMDTVLKLCRDAGLEFVVAPVPGLGGTTVRPLGPRHTVAVFPFLVRASEFVITHGEPHPGNVMRTGPRRLLVDWDTVGLGPPERDLWMVVSETGEEARRYARLTGRAVDPARLAMYRLRWALDDISAFVSELRAEHRHTADTEHAWLALKQTVKAATGPESGLLK